MSSALRRRYGYAKADPWGPDKAAVQAILFPKENWTVNDARIWAELHGFNAKTYDEVSTYIRIHPKGNKVRAARVRTLPYGIGGIRAVVEWKGPSPSGKDRT